MTFQDEYYYDICSTGKETETQKSHITYQDYTDSQW